MERLVGNAQAKQFIEQMLRSGKLGQTLLFAGPKGVGKGLFARALAKRVLCQNEKAGQKFDHGNHPDLHVYEPEGKSNLHPIESMRGFAKEVSLVPNEAPRKVFIIEEADRMQAPSANALLKTFEEPAEDALIILVSSAREKLLPTILSRCRTLYFSPVSQEEIQGVVGDERIARLAQGSIARALELKAHEGALPTDILIEHLSRGHWRNPLLLPSMCEDLAKLEPGLLFEEILLWFRDLHLLKDSGDTSRVFFQSHIDHLLAAVDHPIPEMETIQRAITRTRDALERFSRPEAALQALFLSVMSVPERVAR